jgi:tryptophan synthase alpha chain
VARRRKIFSLFVTAGFPRPDQTIDLVEAAVGAGVDLIELGIPFSDPVADGPVIQHSSDIALAHGMNVRKTIEMAASITTRVPVPVVLMGYVNPMYAFGLKQFMSACSTAAISGLIIPDLPPEEGSEYLQLASDHGIATILLASPTTPVDRLRKLDGLSSGFLYLVSVAGVTGTRTAHDWRTTDFIRTARSEVRKNPMLVGFGISTPADAARVARLSDGIIVGSSFIRSVLDAPVPPWRAAIDLISSLRISLDTCEVS